MIGRLCLVAIIIGSIMMMSVIFIPNKKVGINIFWIGFAIIFLLIGVPMIIALLYLLVDWIIYG